ncbi:pyridoxamine 5'-phosphate oxidase family protein [Alkalihalophilus marmarensis]|uniref:pyridoxamine 5'-phosphate oxidase family protein n=1 Tax=Alkalihalophilus marmarensis TaxID=521377 RepID=UPI002DBBEA2D|nr:pyridoxamine 5'-phosphate oxidase family protein [Alkalihalophilus marmarensis]MEC2070673.1 pyridoxamine 5'-phosphate oxidase family protein [Alkalihalophilus marmarensis]
MKLSDYSFINTENELLNMLGEPSLLAKRKVIDHIDRHVSEFLSKSPFVVISTANAAGLCDASPRGDAPGFVSILDSKTLIIPERPGNKRLDSIKNILQNSHIGLLCIIPGLNETLRINGKARVTNDQNLLESMSVKGKIPILGIVVEVEECFIHCAKAFIRSNLWDSTSYDSELPNPASILSSHAKTLKRDTETIQQQLEESYTQRLY